MSERVDVHGRRAVLGSMNASLPEVVLDPGDSHPVVVTMDRGSVTGPIAVDALPQGVTASPLTILPGSSAGTFDFTAATTITIPQDVDAGGGRGTGFDAFADAGGAPGLSGSGGGGGSAFVSSEGASPKLLAASGQNPAGMAMVGYADSGAAFGGGYGDAGQALSGAAGLVVVAYPK